MGRRHLHISGIGGTAMAAVARLALDAGWRVTGSDADVYPPMSEYLAAMGMEIRPFAAANLEPPPDRVVIGNALSRGNVEVEAVLDRGLPYISGPRFIGEEVLPGRHAVVVTGTHGKTTTASMLAHILEVAGLEPGFMIGGVLENFGGGARLGRGRHFVIEGDEYDTAFFDKRSKFLHYHARTLILNNLEYDHADIFPDIGAIQKQFHHLVRTVPASGRLIVNADDPHLAEVLAMGCWTPVISFAQRGGADAEWHWQAEDERGSAFRLLHGGRRVLTLHWHLLGRHNIANACAATAAATALGVEPATVRRALAGFKGVRRRMTLVGEEAGVRIYDDFAHHPTAIAHVVAAARAAMCGNGRLWVILEPRSNTMRTRIHQKRLPSCLRAAQRVILVPPEGRNLKPDDRLDVEAVCRELGAHARVLPDVEAIVRYVTPRVRKGDHVLILSNGGFGGIQERLLAALREL